MLEQIQIENKALHINMYIKKKMLKINMFLG